MSIIVNDKNLGHVSAYAYAKSKGYTGTEEEFAQLMASYADVAVQAEASAEDSEAHAVGQRNGVDVGPEDPTYHNNAKYYAEQAASGSGSSFDLSDRMAKGVDGNGDVVDGAVVEGDIANNKASGNNSHAEGSNTTASGVNSYAEGGGTKALGAQSHAEGGGTTASGVNSHAEGGGTTASGLASHAEGTGARAIGGSSHAEGSGTNASGDYSHAEGSGTTASGTNSHAGGFVTKASRKSQTVIGEYNIEDTTGGDGSVRGNYAFIIGNGTSDNKRSNAFAVKWDGTFVFADGTEITPTQLANAVSGPFIVNVDTTRVMANDTTTYTVMSCSATYSEIKSAYDSGRLCEARILVGGQAYPGAPRTNTIIPLSSLDDLAGIIQFDSTHANLYKQLVIRKSGSPIATYQESTT